MKPVLMLKDYPELEAASKALTQRKIEAVKFMKEYEEKTDKECEELHDKLWKKAYAIMQEKNLYTQEQCEDLNFTIRDGVLHEREEEDLKKDLDKSLKDILKKVLQ